MSTSSQEKAPVQAASSNLPKEPRLMKTKIVVRCYGGFVFLTLAGTLLEMWVPNLFQNSLLDYVFRFLFSPVIILTFGLFFVMLKLPWFAVAIISLPMFPALFLFFRRSWLQFIGMVHHLAMAGFLLYCAVPCLYYYYHFDEIERNDNPGILAVCAWLQGASYVIDAVIFIVFTVMLYYDYRALKKYRSFSPET